VRKMFLPIRPKPLIPTLTAMCSSPPDANRPYDPLRFWDIKCRACGTGRRSSQAPSVFPATQNFPLQSHPHKRCVVDKQSVGVRKNARLCGEFVPVKRAIYKFLKPHLTVRRSTGLIRWTMICQNVSETPSLA